MRKTDEKVLRAIKATEKFIKGAEADGVKTTFDMGCAGIGMTVLGCAKRNLEEYKQILGQDKRKLQGRLKELYLSI